MKNETPVARQMIYTIKKTKNKKHTSYAKSLTLVLGQQTIDNIIFLQEVVQHGMRHQRA